LVGQVLTVITEHIPELKAMDLSENKLTSLDAFLSFANKMPNLSILYLADNRIPDIRFAFYMFNYIFFWYSVCVGNIGIGIKLVSYFAKQEMSVAL
jgi:hypothetical protein